MESRVVLTFRVSTRGTANFHPKCCQPRQNRKVRRWFSRHPPKPALEKPSTHLRAYVLQVQYPTCFLFQISKENQDQKHPPGAYPALKGSVRELWLYNQDYLAHFQFWRAYQGPFPLRCLSSRFFRSRDMCPGTLRVALQYQPQRSFSRSTMEFAALKRIWLLDPGPNGYALFLLTDNRFPRTVRSEE